MKEKNEMDNELEICVFTFDLDRRGRREEVVDMKHLFIRWWDKNMNQFEAYKTMTSVAELMKVHHTTINHLQKHRKKSLRYNENTKGIKNYLIEMNVWNLRD